MTRSKNGLLSCLRLVASFQFQVQRFNHTLAQVDLQAQLHPEIVPHPAPPQVKFDRSIWRKIDSRSFGITRSMISPASLTVLKILQSEEFKVYLVGGCVRDLLLNKAPKDYDVITTATLEEVKGIFHHCGIVGKKFPVCRVHMKGSVIEVSSFETVAQHAEEKEKALLSQMPHSCNKNDFLRLRNSMHQDFTINSLFFDPFVNKIYDYANGIADLEDLKLRTLVPAHLSFTEDCARILRGLRIAARLGLSVSKETDTAMHKLSSSIRSLDKFRMMLELNYMLSYGAALHSVHLLQKYNLLKILLPLQAAYLDEQASKNCAQSSTMLMKLFSNLDKLVTCDKPSDCSLWVGLLAFHLALVNNPQDARIVWAFASALYHGNWKGGAKSAREYAQVRVQFVPEISELSHFDSDEELAENVTKFASLVQHSIAALTDEDSLRQSMSRYPDFPCSCLVFVPRRAWDIACCLFQVLTTDIESYDKGRENFNINYFLLGKGNVLETRFALGKIILETMKEGVVQPTKEFVAEEKEELQTHKIGRDQKPDGMEEGSVLSDLNLKKQEAKMIEDRKRRSSPCELGPEHMTLMKQKLVERDCNVPRRLEVVNGKQEEGLDTSELNQSLVKKESNMKPHSGLFR